MAEIHKIDIVVGATDKASMPLKKIAGSFMAATIGANVLMGAFRGITGAFNEAFDKARQFNKSMAEVATMLDNVSIQRLPKMTTQIRSMAIEWGRSAIDLSRGLYQVLSASIDSAKAMDVLNVAVKASIAGLTSVEVAVDAITTVLNSFGMAAEEAGRVSDIMFQTIKRGKLRFDDLAGALGYVVPIASQAGISFEEVAAAMATLTRSGIRAQKATTGLRQLISGLVAPTEAVIDASMKYGVIINDIALEVLGLEGMMSQLNEATEGSTKKFKELIPNVRALTAGLGLTGDAAEGFSFDLQSMQDAMGATERAAAKMQQTIDFQFAQLESRIEDLRMEIGMKPSVQKGKEWWEHFVGYSQSAIGQVADGFTIMKDAAGAFYDVTWGGNEKGRTLMEAWRDIAEDWTEKIHGSTMGMDALVAATEKADKAMMPLNMQLKDASSSGERASIIFNTFSDDINSLIGQMSNWGNEIDRTRNLITRIELECEQLTIDITKLTNEFNQYDIIKQYEDALHYIPLALEDSTYTSRIFDETTKALIDSIRIQRREITDLNKANNLLAMDTRTNSLEAMKIELSAMGRRGRYTRAEKKRLKDLRKEDLLSRIETTKNQLAVDKIKNKGLTVEEKRLQRIQISYQEEVRAKREALDTTKADMERNLNWKKTQLNTYETQFLPKVREQHMDALNNYQAGLMVIERTWSDAQIGVWEETAGGIKEQRDKILGYKMDVAFGGATGIDLVRQMMDAFWARQGRRNPFRLPTGHTGIPYVPRTQPYLLHEGERVVPKNQNMGGGYPSQIKVNANINITVRDIYDTEKLAIKLQNAIQQGLISGVSTAYG
jgi:TP901 family phage tail tape measure protein